MTDPHKALRDALAAGPTDGPRRGRKGFDDEVEIFRPDASIKRPYIAHQICTIERYHKDAKANIAFLLAANPAAIRALLDELDAANKAIAKFCADQEWAAESWKAQKHIAPLFEIYAKHKDRT